MMIRITQWLCSRRHCSIALAWDPSTTTEKEILSEGEAVYASGAVAPPPAPEMRLLE